jgi:hypothetical protein
LIYLLTRPFAWLFALVLLIVTLPMKLVMAVQNHRMRKNAKFAAKHAKSQIKEAKQARK